ncbi:unnamed protein product, partial [Oikopleura dioica]
ERELPETSQTPSLMRSLIASIIFFSISAFRSRHSNMIQDFLKRKFI